jgi:hypothetical protein
LFYLVTGGDHFIEALHVLLAKTDGHAKFTQIAAGTSDFDGFWCCYASHIGFITFTDYSIAFSGLIG